MGAGTEQSEGGSQPDVFTKEQQDVIAALLAKKVDEVKGEYKSQIDGLNRRNSELEKALKEQKEELEKSKLSEAEKFKYEIEQKEKALKEKERELTLRSNKEVALKFATENKIPVDFVEFLPLESADDLKAALEKMKAVVEKDRSSVLDEFKKQGGAGAPAGGGDPKKEYVNPDALKSMSIEEINKAFNEGKIKL